MFIMTNINPEQNTVTILDTQDNTVEMVALYPVAQQINAGMIQVIGLKPHGKDVPNPFNLKVSAEEARKAYIKHFAYVNGITEAQAKQMLGMS